MHLIASMQTEDAPSHLQRQVARIRDQLLLIWCECDPDTPRHKESN